MIIDDEKCPFCFGTGEEPDHTNHDCSPIECKECDGTGFRNAEWDEINAGEEKFEARNGK